MKILTRITGCCTYGEGSGTDASKNCERDSSFYADTRKGKAGYLFTMRVGRVLDQRNSLKALHGAGNRGGFHAFRRFRFAVLRRAGVPDNLIKLWMGHSQNLMDLYAAQLRYDVA